MINDDADFARPLCCSTRQIHTLASKGLEAALNLSLPDCGRRPGMAMHSFCARARRPVRGRRAGGRECRGVLFSIGAGHAMISFLGGRRRDWLAGLAVSFEGKERG